MDIGRAAEMLEHYIKLALEKGGVIMSGEMLNELSQAVEAFHAAARRLEQLDRRTIGQIMTG